MLTIHEINSTIKQACPPQAFFSPRGDLLFREAGEEEIVWEIFSQRLLDESQTRQRCAMISWHLQSEEGEVPLVSLRYDAAVDCLHVVRQIYVYGWQAYEPQPQVIESREVRKWASELVGTIPLASCQRQEYLKQQIACFVRLAICGSRLPITSLESPLPAYSLGQLAFFPSFRAADSLPGNSWQTARQLIEHGICQSLTSLDRARILETVLRAADSGEIESLSRVWLASEQQSGRSTKEIAHTVRTMFHNVALSPYTKFGDNWVDWLRLWSDEDQLGSEPVVELTSFILRYLVHHLTAYDLETFHNFGANYPDALLLDGMFQLYLELAERNPELFIASAPDSAPQQMRRRALRSGWLVRCQYEGHPVPDSPTSQGENRRVLPEPFQRVPEEQLTPYGGKRPSQLYEGRKTNDLLSETTREILQQSVYDLRSPAELRSLGLALYLDRPLGVLKAPDAADRTPLVAYEAFSAAIAGQRIRQIVRSDFLLSEEEAKNHIGLLGEIGEQGFPAQKLPGAQRSTVVSLENALQAAPDFVFCRCTSGSLGDLFSHYDFSSLKANRPELAAWVMRAKERLLVRTAEAQLDKPFLSMMDSGGTIRARLGIAQANGSSSVDSVSTHHDPQTLYDRRAESELPAGDLLLWLADSDEPIRLPPIRESLTPSSGLA